MNKLFAVGIFLMILMLIRETTLLIVKIKFGNNIFIYVHKASFN
jgi:hypothetical protein